MTLSAKDRRLCLYAATTAAYRAGNHIMKYYGAESLAYDTKGLDSFAGDVVTVADRESQRIVADILKDLHPDIGFLAEEEDEKENRSRFEKPYFWCVDPLDGTLPFIERVNGFAVAIALVEQSGRPVMGVCYLPAFGDLYHAVAGEGAFFNGRRFSYPKDLGHGRVTLSPNPRDVITPERHVWMSAIAESLGRVDGVERVVYQFHSGAVAKACLLRQFAPALFVGVPRRGNEGCCVWDLAATSVIVTEAGGVVHDLYGQPLDLNRRDCAFCHHRGFVMATRADLAQAAADGFQSVTKDK